MSRWWLFAACLLGGVLSACGDGDTSATGGTGGASTTTGGQGGTGGQTGAEPFRLALSVSPFTGTLFDAGARFTDGTLTATTTEELESLYVAHGANELFARISTERKKTAAGDDHSLETALEKAALARKLGIPFNPELGLWAHYGDISCEPGPDFSEYPEIHIPAPWDTLTLDEMLPALRDYGAAVADEILATGVTVDYWDIGNEIDLGVAGVAPEGFNCATPQLPPNGVDPDIWTRTVLGLLSEPEPDRIAWLKEHVWPHEAKILAAVAEGIRLLAPDARFSTHISQSLSKDFASAFYSALAQNGFYPDRFGFSYYPTGTAGPDRAQKFKDTISEIHFLTGRPAYLAEVAYLSGTISGGPYASWTNPIPKYPLDDEGQSAFFRDLTAWCAAAGMSGIRPWAPEVYVTGWEGFALFDGTKPSPRPARKALSSLAEGASHPDLNAFTDQ